MPKNTAVLSCNSMSSLPGRAKGAHNGGNSGQKLHILNNNKIITIPKALLMQSCHWQSGLINQCSKFLLIDSVINNQTFNMVIKSLQGEDLTFQRSWEAIEVMDLVTELGLETSRAAVFQDLKKHKEEYGFFVLFSMAVKNQIQWLLKICTKELTVLGFEQIQYNKYDFLKCSYNIVQMMVELYQQFLKTNKKGGLKLKKFIESLQQYCQVNHIEQGDTEILMSSILGTQQPKSKNARSRDQGAELESTTVPESVLGKKRSLRRNSFSSSPYPTVLQGAPYITINSESTCGIDDKHHRECSASIALFLPQNSLKAQVCVFKTAQILSNSDQIKRIQVVMQDLEDTPNLISGRKSSCNSESTAGSSCQNLPPFLGDQKEKNN